MLMLVTLPLLADNPPASQTPSPNGASRTFDVKGYLVEGNASLLPPEKIAGVLSNHMGRIDLARLRQGLGELQLLYRNLGFATVGVTLPQQHLTNGIVRVKVVQGKLSAIKVAGNQSFSSNNVLRALPSLATNILLNTKWFQPELDCANANQDRQIYPVIGPGLDPGTTELTLKVKDRFPLHGHIEVNDKATPNTPLLRVDTALQYNNLWQHEHQVGVQYTFSPQDYKTDRYANPLDQPMVASYSGFYRIPLGQGDSLRETYANLPVDFGYDQVTHQFRLPPPTGRPELLILASRSVSDTPPRAGTLTNITHTATLDVDSQFVQRDLTFNNDIGARFILPLSDVFGIKSSLSAGFDLKTFESSQFSTNLAYIVAYTTNSGTRIPYASYTIPNTLNSRNSLQYVPLTIGWSATRQDPWGNTSFYWNQNVFLESLQSARTNFQTAANSAAAGDSFTTLAAGLTREQALSHDWSLLLRAAGQWASSPLISNEQFALGGIGGVRGYREGEAYGDSGWRVLLETKAPAIRVGSFPHEPEDIPAHLRCSWFMDYGEAYSSAQSATPTIRQWGTGIGFYLTAGEHFDARLTLAWALRDTPTTRAGNASAYFSVGTQF
jgi:hemolysin activation/secretion protein